MTKKLLSALFFCFLASPSFAATNPVPFSLLNNQSTGINNENTIVQYVNTLGYYLESVAAQLINLATQVTGVLPVANGGTGQSVSANIVLAQKAAQAASVSNLVINPVNSTTTIASPASAPSTTGFTANNIEGQNIYATTTAGSNVVAVTSTNNLTVGSYVPEYTSSYLPLYIPLGAQITAINTVANTITISKPAISNGGASFNGTTVGSVLTVNSITSGKVGVGQIITGSGINSFVFITSLGTGTGGTGTYNLSSGSYSVGPESMTSNVYMYNINNNINYIGGVPNQVSNTGMQLAGGTAVASAPSPQGAGGALEFMTDAANFTTSSTGIIFQVNTNSATPNSFLIAVDDVYQSAAPIAYNSTGTQYVTVQFSSPGNHKVRFEMPASLQPQTIYVPTGTSIWRTYNPTPVTACMFGDSYFAFAAPSTWQMRNIGAITADIMGWQPDFMAVGGTGYVNNNTTNFNWTSAYRQADCGRANHNFVVILGSINDDGDSSATITANAITTWMGLRAQQPNATFIIFGVQSYPNATNGATNETALQSAFTTWGDTNSYFIPIANDPDGAWLTSANATFSGGGYLDYATFNGTITGGTTLTVNSITGGVLRVGQSLAGTGVTNSPTIASFGTGTGQTGTYTLSASSANVGPETMTSGDDLHPSEPMGEVYYAARMAQKIKNVLSIGGF